MRIETVRLLRLRGRMEHPDTFWEERLIRPVDVYPERASDGPGELPRGADGRLQMQSIFLEIVADEGVTGIAGPITPLQAFLIDTEFKRLLIGADPLATERIWDLIYRAQVHGRKGIEMMTLSVVDCALWDLKGKWAGVPVHRLLGGPLRTEFPAYASALGFSIEPERAAERARSFAEEGYRATKWFFRKGPADGPEGMRSNLALAEALRGAVGEDVDVMLDCWMSWSEPYAIEMARRLQHLRPRWLEEPVLPDRIDGYARIRQASPVPISGGEHEYTRWGVKQLLDAGAVDVLQPDIYWAGGISEMVKICAIASTYGIPVVPHGHSVQATVNLIAAQPESLCPLVEYLIKWNQVHQFFLARPLRPEGGVVRLPDLPGLGMELAEDRIEEREELHYA